MPGGPFTITFCAGAGHNICHTPLLCYLAAPVSYGATEHNSITLSDHTYLYKYARSCIEILGIPPCSSSHYHSCSVWHRHVQRSCAGFLEANVWRQSGLVEALRRRLSGGGMSWRSMRSIGSFYTCRTSGSCRLKIWQRTVLYLS